MCSACRLILLYICVKFHENISNCFQITEWTRVHGRNGYVQCSKGSNSNSRQIRDMVPLICVKFGETISDGIRVMERTRMMEVLTDGRMYTSVSPYVQSTLMGRKLDTQGYFVHNF